MGIHLRGPARLAEGHWLQDVAITRGSTDAMARRVLARLHFVERGEECILLRLEHLGERLVHPSLPEPDAEALAAIAARPVPTLLGDDTRRADAPTTIEVADDPSGRWIDTHHYRLHLHLTYALRLTPCRVAKLRRVVHEALFRRDDALGWQLIAARRIDSRDPWTDFPISTRNNAACPPASAIHR